MAKCFCSDSCMLVTDNYYFTDLYRIDSITAEQCSKEARLSLSVKQKDLGLDCDWAHVHDFASDCDTQVVKI